MNIPGLLKKKRQEILRLAEQRGARNVRIFGSIARGDSGPGSDVDFLVEMEEATTLPQHNALIRELQELLGCNVDVVSERSFRARMRDRVMKEAVPI